MSVRALRRGTMAGRGSAGTPTTYTIFGNTADGYVSASPPSQADGNGGGAPTTGDAYVGLNGSNAYETFLAFDTSAAAGTITSVTLHLWGAADSSATDFTIEARVHDWGATLTSTDWLSMATLGTKTLVASRSTAGWSLSGYNLFTSEAAFPANINQAGFTRLVLCGSNHRLGLGGSDYVGLKTADASGTSNDPKLVIEALV